MDPGEQSEWMPKIIRSGIKVVFWYAYRFSKTQKETYALLSASCLLAVDVRRPPWIEVETSVYSCRSRCMYQAKCSSRTLHCPQYPLFTGLLPRASPTPVVWWPLRTLPSCLGGRCAVCHWRQTSPMAYPEWPTYSLPHGSSWPRTHASSVPHCGTCSDISDLGHRMPHRH